MFLQRPPSPFQGEKKRSDNSAGRQISVHLAPSPKSAAVSAEAAGGAARAGRGRVGQPRPPRLSGRHEPRLSSRPTSAPAAAAAGRAPAPPVPGERPRGGTGLALPVRSPRGCGEGRVGAEGSLTRLEELPGPRWPSFGVPGCDAWQNWESPPGNLQPKHLVRYSAATGLSQTNFAAV